MPREALQQYAVVAARAAQQVGARLVRFAGRPNTVSTKRSAIDLVTDIDRSSEQTIHRILRRAFPDFGFLGEERGERYQPRPYRWIVDPIDGTNNFVHGVPLFGVSIGLEHRGTMVIGVIYDPMRRELFVGIKGHGAFLNGKRIHASKTRTLAHSLVSTGFSSNFLKNPRPYWQWFREFQRRSHGVRRIGTTVLSLAWVAAGRLEGFYERDLWPWDMAAGIVLVQEAGGMVTNFQGKPPILIDGRLIASNRHIHREMLRLIRSAGTTR